jgi:hypothetical protein
MDTASCAKGRPARCGGFVRILVCFDNGAASAQTACRRWEGTRLWLSAEEKEGLWMIIRWG